MPQCRYPRPGQRLAPTLLRDALRVPLPARFCRSDRNSTWMLCDLDERAWEHFGPEACQELAAEVVATVGRVMRSASPLLCCRLPALPTQMRMTDLELNPRTVNSLRSAGLLDRPQDLPGMTIGQLLSLRGFWVKSLVDLLSAIEYASSHPESKGSANGNPSRRRSELHRYPQPGHRLAPQTLREFLDELIPEHLARGTQFEGQRLYNLDESVWEHFTPGAISDLAALVVARVAAGMHTPLLHGRRVPRPPKSVHLEDLRLENRTSHCLQQVGLGDRLDALAGWTIGDLMSIQAFGAKCLLDLLCALETTIAREGRLDHRLTTEARALAAMPEVGPIHFNDPRLGPLLRNLDHTADTLWQMMAKLLKRRTDPPDPAQLCLQLIQLRQTISDYLQRPLEDELTEIFVPENNPRDRNIMAAYLGWGGKPGQTLESLGQQCGLSRERVRQVCALALKRSQGIPVFAPVLDRALAFVSQRLPSPTDSLEATLRSSRITRSVLPLTSLNLAAAALGREQPLAIARVGSKDLAVRPEHAGLPLLVAQAATRMAQTFGVATVDQIRTSLVHEHPQAAGQDSLLLQTLQLLPDFAWLDKRCSWFRLNSLPQYGLRSMIDKVLSLAKQIDVSRLHSALGRCRRVRRRLPPPSVLLEFCRQTPGIVVDGTLVREAANLDWRQVLRGVELGMAEVLHEHGPVLDRTHFEELCARRGIKAFSFNASLMSSPIIIQAMRSVYALVGTRVDRQAIDSAIAVRREVAHPKVLDACWRSPDGTVCLAYRLSKAAISGGVITVPVDFKTDVVGRFNLLTNTGRKLGTMVAKNGCAWGLGPALRSQTAKPGDHLLLLVKPANREVRVRIGNEELLRKWGPPGSNTDKRLPLRDKGRRKRHAD